MIIDYRQSVFKRNHSDKHLSEFLPTTWQQKSISIDMEQNYVTVTLCINVNNNRQKEMDTIALQGLCENRDLSID